MPYYSHSVFEIKLSFRYYLGKYQHFMPSLDHKKIPFISFNVVDILFYFKF